MKKLKLLFVYIIMFLFMVIPVYANENNVNIDKESYTITYDLKGGKQNPKNVDTFYEDTKTFALYEPSRKGYTFGGWYLIESPKTKIVEIKKGTTKNIEVYASWTANRYGIAYYGNGATGGTTSNQTKLKYGMNYNLSPNGFVRTGYKFIGWNTKADGTGTTFKDEETIKNFTSTNGKTVKLYAQWEKIKYFINYDLKGGIQNSKNITEFYATSKTFNLYNPTKKGYTFGGWYLNGTKTKITQVKNGTTKNIDVFASWTANRYGIAYYGNGATGGSTSNQKNLKYGMTYNLSTNGFVRTGYTFIGWNTKADATGTYFSNQQKIKNFTSTNGKVVKLYAIWKANKYNIEFVYDSDVQMDTVTFKYGMNYYLPTNIYEKPGYKFMGWNTKPSGKGTTYKDGQKVKNLTAKNGGTVKLYPIWGPEIPKITSIENLSYEDSKITVSIGEGAEGYLIYRSNSKTGKYVKVATITDGSSTFIDSNLTSRKTYYYKIVSYTRNEYGKIIYSEDSKTYSNTTAAKPKFSATVDNDDGVLTIYVVNNGVKDMVFSSYALFIPFSSNTNYTIGAYLKGGSRIPNTGSTYYLPYYLEDSSYFYSSSAIFTSFTYDGCTYWVHIGQNWDIDYIKDTF